MLFEFKGNDWIWRI